MEVLIAFLAAVVAGYTLAVGLPRGGEENDLRVMRSAPEGKQKAKIPGAALLAKLPLPVSREKLRRQLYWAQAGGRFRGWSEEEFVALQAGSALLAFVVFMLLGGRLLIAFAAAFSAFMYWNARLDTLSKEAIREIRRELPEAALMAAVLVSSGENAENALKEIAKGRVLLSRWIRDRMAAKPPGRELWQWLAEEAEKTGIGALRSFMVRMGRVANKGTEAYRLLADVAVAEGRRYVAEVDEEAEKLEDELTLPVGIFFFIPYLAFILLPFIWTLATKGGMLFR